MPQNGVNEHTGILLLISGFGGQATSNVYKKMRDKFSDDYNLVIIQCDYFGYEFMQEADRVFLPTRKKFEDIFSDEEIQEIYKDGQPNIDAIFATGSKYNIKIDVEADLSNENIDNFNDMGLLQAIDNITAVLNVMNILYDNNYCFNSKKVIIYGHSHGAYLSYLCNAFAPKLFSLIIDNSAWLVPVYLNDVNRFIIYKRKNLILKVVFEYLAKKVVDDMEILNLTNLYSKFENNCKVISYHGITDNLINYTDKKSFCNEVDKCVYNEITQDKVDDTIFKSTNHGLNADFIKLFDYTINNFNIQFQNGTDIELQNEVVFETSKHKYIVDYINVVPRIHIL